jgi:acyl-CoA thioesterase-1
MLFLARSISQLHRQKAFRSYVGSARKVQRSYRRAAVTFACTAVIRMARACLVFAVVALALGSPLMAQEAAGERLVKIVALGDSLTAGYGLPAGDAFPVKLSAALKAKGANVQITNAGVSGDTSSGGLERLDWAIEPDTDAVILELGANDGLRGIDPKVTRKAIDAIVKRLADRNITVLLCGMLAPPNLGSEYGTKFNVIFPDIAKSYNTLLYPFFLTGVVADPKLNQRDGMHPTAKGVDIIVTNILPSVEQLIARVKSQRGS